MNKEYYLGIDIGTNSVGFASTDTEYNLLKKGSKSIWGVRVFEETKTAVDRRIFRNNRRRLQRRKERIKLLEMLFSEEIYKVDQSFFIRLKESKLHKEDRSSKMEYDYTLFNDRDFNDKQYYEKYKTIAHLRKALIESDEKIDIRLIYLAIHNIIKNRGHFLFENLNDKKPTFKDVFDNLNIYLNNRFDFYFDYDKYDELEKIIKEDTKQKDKEKRLNQLFCINKKTDIQKSLLTSALSNGKFDLCKLFEDESLKGNNNKNLTLKLSEIEDDTLDKIPLSDEDKNIIVILKSIYDWSILENILKEDDYISFARVKIYEQHKEDLVILKKFVKENFDKSKYDEIFNNKLKNGYCNYVGHSKKGYIKKCSKQEFYKTIENLLKNATNKKSKEYLYISEKIEKNTFLPKQINKDNGIIPYQVNLFELKEILTNASKHYPFLLQKDNDGLTVQDKIISILKFKIPYYVGPLNEHSPYSWIKKYTDEKIYPWNFEKVVNIEESSEKFIRRMTNKCTYLSTEDVLAKNSLLYSEYMVLNEINNLRINDVKIGVEIKKRIFNEVFCTTKKVTPKKIKDFLIANGEMKKEDTLSGIDIDIKSSMASYINFKWLIDKYNDINLIDNIINYSVIFGNDKKILKSKITNKYGHLLDKEEIKKCCSYKYTGWGRLSKKFLTEITDVNKATGEILNIMDMLRETNNNLMELLSNNYNFLDKIKEENSLIDNNETILDKVNNLYVSPKIKRPIYQSLLIIKEIIKTQKNPPKKIFIEIAREKVDEKKRSKKRKQKLLELYKNIKKEYEGLYTQLEKTEDKEFNKIKLYLYYLQLGKCMYTANDINIENLMNASIYDRDHIYPQSKIKDDSFDNLVLVDRRANATKNNVFPIAREVQEKMSTFWYSLKQKGLMTEEKYKRLTRKTEFSEDELNVFVNRQLVETRQATKAVGQILKDIYPDIKIVYVKAGLVSDFRKKYDLLKCREVNDYHHAKDAYLNIVVGNVYDTEFTSKYYVKRIRNNEASLKKMFEYKVDGAWIVDKDKSINIVKNTMLKNNILFTRYSDTKRGQLFNQTIYPAHKNDNLLPLKKGLDINKYGGYDSKSVAYFMVVEHTSKKKRVRSMDFVYMYNKHEYKENPEKYCEEILGLVEPKVIIKQIKINTLFSLDGLYLHLSGKSKDSLLFKPAMQLILSYEEEKYIKKIANCVEKGEEYFKNNNDYILNQIEITKEKNIQLYNRLAYKIKNSKYIVVFTNIYNYMNESKDKFENSISLYEQCKILLETIKILQCNSTKGDFGALFNGKNNELGRIIVNKSTIFTKYNKVKIIYPSITGLYEQEVDLLGDDFIPKRRR